MNTRVLFVSLLGAVALSACNCGSKPAVASRLVFSTQPASGTAGAPLAAIAVTLQDADGKTVKTAQAVTVSLAENAAGGVLGGTAVVDSVEGVATFETLSIQRAGTGYTLTATADGLEAATSAPFDVGAAAASQLAITGQPTELEAGTVIDPPVALKLTDAFGNPVPGAAVTMVIAENPGDATLTGTTSRTTDGDGAVSFADLSLDRVGTGYTLVAATSALAPVATQPFNVRAGPPAALEFFVQPPAQVTVGVPMDPAVKVLARDRFGNAVDRPLDVTVALTSDSPAGTLGGTLTAAVVSGLATFADLTVNLAGSGYALSAAAPGVTGATSSPFEITEPGLVYVDPPAGGKLRLVRNAASTQTQVVLDLVAAVDLTGYSVGFNLPLDTTRVAPGTSFFTPGTALPAGSSPSAAAAVLPSTGPLASVLVTGQSQKASGTGAVATDTVVPAGSVLYTVRLDAVAGAPLGLVFDGAALGPKFRARMRDKAGTDVATAGDFRIGTLRLR